MTTALAVVFEALKVITETIGTCSFRFTALHLNMKIKLGTEW